MNGTKNEVAFGRLLQRKVTYISVLSLPSRPRGYAQPESWPRCVQGAL